MPKVRRKLCLGKSYHWLTITFFVFLNANTKFQSFYLEDEICNSFSTNICLFSLKDSAQYQ